MANSIKKIGKLNITLRQWREIYNKEMSISADLRNIERLTNAFNMMMVIEKNIAEITNEA